MKNTYEVTTLRELNKRGYYTLDQLRSWKKFAGKYLNVYPNHFLYKPNGKWHFETVYEVRSIKDEIWENHETVEEIAQSIPRIRGGAFA